eukprot:1195478-Prorocentrum_minimum.AAC.3
MFGNASNSLRTHVSTMVWSSACTAARHAHAGSRRRSIACVTAHPTVVSGRLSPKSPNLKGSPYLKTALRKLDLKASK